MAKAVIQDDHRVARHCTRKRDFVDDEMTELQADSFAPSVSDPDISVAWLDYHAGALDEQIDAVCRDMSYLIDVRTNHKLALLNVGAAKSIGIQCGQKVNLAHDPINGYKCHTLIRGVPIDDAILHQRLADAASEHLVPAVRYKKRS